MSEIRKLKAQVRKNAEKKLIEFRAVLGRADGTVKADAENVYVTLFNGEVITVYNERLPFVPYRKIIIGYEDDETLLQVLRFDNVYTSRPHPSLPNHKDSHSWFGYDPIEVYPEQFMELLPRAIGGMVVRVHGGDYYCNSIDCLLNTIDIDLTDEIPAAGAEWVNVEVDENKLLSFTHGAKKPARELLLPADKPARTTGKQLLFSAKMYVGMTEFAQTKKTNDIFDPRFVSGYSSGGGGIPDAPSDGSYYGRLNSAWVNLKTYFDSLYSVLTHTHAGLSLATDTKRQGILDPSETTIAFDGTNIFTLASVGASWSYYRAGIKHTITGNKTVNLAVSPPAAAGDWHIFIDATDGTLTASLMSWTLNDTKVPVASIQWDNTKTPKYWLADERHTSMIDSRMQYYLHFTDGAQLITVPTLSGQTVNTDTNAAKTCGISAGTLLDQDIIHTIAELTDPNGTAADYSVWYRTAASTWSWKAANMPFAYNVGNTNDAIQWDNGGTMTDASDFGGGSHTRWINSYLLITNKSGAARFIIVPGRGEFTSLIAAQAEDVGSFSWAGFEVDEARVAYRFTWTTATATSQGKCMLAATPQSIDLGITRSIAPVNIPVTTTANDFQVGDGAGAWIKKTLTEVKTILGLGTAAYTASSDYAVAAKGVTNGDSHDHSGGDGAAIVEAAITLADNTTNNASTSNHGFLKKLSNTATEFMNGQGNWATPAGGSYLFGFGTYIDGQPLTTTGYPYGGTVDRTTTFVQWTQSVLTVSNQSNSNYWTIRIYKRTGTSTNTLVATLDTKALTSAGTGVLTTTTFDVANVSGTCYLYISAVPTGSPGNIYMLCPALKVTG